MSETDLLSGSDEQMPVNESILDEELAKIGPSTSKRMKLDHEDRSLTATRITRRSARMGGAKNSYETDTSTEQSNINEKSSKDLPVTKEVAKATAGGSMDVGKPALQQQGETREERLKRRQKDDSNEKDDEEKSNNQQDLEDEVDEESPGKPNKQRATIHLLDKSTQSKIKVGQQHQAVLTAYGNKSNSLVEDREDRDQALWIPPLANGELTASDLDKYIEEAMTLHMMPLDRALFILLKSDHNLELARERLAKRKLIRDEWSHDDSVVFQNAFNYYGKNFKIIQKALPHRTINSIVNHYYNIKKSSSSKLNPMKNENDDDRLEEFDDAEFGCCEHCEEKPTKVLYTSGGRLCSPCFVYYTVMHKYRPIDGASKVAPQYRQEARCPSDMTDVVLEFEELYKQATQDAKDTNLEFGTASSSAGSVVRSIESLIEERDQQVRARIDGMRQKVFATNERIRALQKNLAGGWETYRHFVQKEKQEEEENKGRRQRFDYKWTENEKKMAFHLIARYGLEGLSTVAHILQTKNVDQVKAFIKENEETIQKYLFTIETEEENIAKKMNIDDELSRDDDDDVVVLD
ncbi:unnamed protein product, partial [Mesorhabditis belari]|uniref:REST corepressor n=1 Tax=Mesorhabditis belari TaxID=2138241 RepID=A0AAF3J476_9BILA